MCTCASCEYTDGFADKSFADWPRGEPAGPRRSAADYSAHVAHLWEGVRRHGVAFEPGQAPIYPSIPGLVHAVQPNATAIRWNAGRGQKYVEPPEIKPVEMSTASLLLLARRLRDEERQRRRSIKLAA